jgi:elongation factor P
MADTSDFRNGMCIEFRNDLYTIVQFQHVKPGKGAAFVRTKLKSLTTGKVVENTFSAGEKVTPARVERRPYQYLYTDDMGYHFMDNNTFEQISIEKDLINAPDFLKEGGSVDIIFHADTERTLGCELPQHVILEITYTEPSVKGNTASSTALKPAKLETGAEVNVPIFIEINEKIKVDTRDGSYVERVKE